MFAVAAFCCLASRRCWRLAPAKHHLRHSSPYFTIYLGLAGIRFAMQQDLSAANAILHTYPVQPLVCPVWAARRCASPPLQSSGLPWPVSLAPPRLEEDGRCWPSRLSMNAAGSRRCWCQLNVHIPRHSRCSVWAACHCEQRPYNTTLNQGPVIDAVKRVFPGPNLDCVVPQACRGDIVVHTFACWYVARPICDYTHWHGLSSGRRHPPLHGHRCERPPGYAGGCASLVCRSRLSIHSSQWCYTAGGTEDSEHKQELQQRRLQATILLLFARNSA